MLEMPRLVGAPGSSGRKSRIDKVRGWLPWEQDSAPGRNGSSSLFLETFQEKHGQGLSVTLILSYKCHIPVGRLGQI